MFIMKYVAFEQNCFAGSYETFPSINDVIFRDLCMIIIYYYFFENNTESLKFLTIKVVTVIFI